MGWMGFCCFPKQNLRCLTQINSEWLKLGSGGRLQSEPRLYKLSCTENSEEEQEWSKMLLLEPDFVQEP